MSNPSYNYSQRQLPVQYMQEPKDALTLQMHEHRRPPDRDSNGLLQGFPAGRGGSASGKGQEYHQQQQHQQQYLGEQAGWTGLWASFRNTAQVAVSGQSAEGGGRTPSKVPTDQQQRLPHHQQRPLKSIMSSGGRHQHRHQKPKDMVAASATHRPRNLGIAPAAPPVQDYESTGDHRTLAAGPTDQSVKTMNTESTAFTYGTTTTYGGGMSTKTPVHMPKPDKAGYNRKWTDVAYKKYQMGMSYYRARDYDNATLCFNHVLRIRHSLRQDMNHPDVLNASKMENRIAYMKRKVDRAKRKIAKRDARARKREEAERRMLAQAEEDAAQMKQKDSGAGKHYSDNEVPSAALRSTGKQMPMKPPAAGGAVAPSGRQSSSKDAKRRSRSRSRSREKKAMAQAIEDAGKRDDGSSRGSREYGTDTEAEDEDSAEDDEDVSLESDISDLSASIYSKHSRLFSRIDSSADSRSQSAGTEKKESNSPEQSQCHTSMEDVYKRQHEELVKERVRRSSMPMSSQLLEKVEDAHRSFNSGRPSTRASTGALGDDMVERALEKLSITDNSMRKGDSIPPSAEIESANISARLRSSFQKFDDLTKNNNSTAKTQGHRNEFLKFMNAALHLHDEEIGDEQNAIEDGMARECQTLDQGHQNAINCGDEHQDGPSLGDDEDDDISYDSDETPEDFDEESFAKSLVGSNDDDEYEEEGGEGGYDDAFDEYTAASGRPISIVGGVPPSGASVVSAMCESTASEWQEEQSLVAQMLRKDQRPRKGARKSTRQNADTKKDVVGGSGEDPDAEGISASESKEAETVSALSLEDWQKFKKAARSIYANANAVQSQANGAIADREVANVKTNAVETKTGQNILDAAGGKDSAPAQELNRENSENTKPREFQLGREYSVVSSMVDTTASDWHNRQDDADDAPDDVQALEDVSAGNYALATGNYDEARTRFVSALRRMVKILGPNHEEVSLIQEMLGDACAKLGEVKEAHGHYQLARQNLQEKLGKHDRNVTRIMVSLGCLYFTSGNYSRALKYHSSILELRRMSLEDDHPDILESVEKNMEVHEALVARAIERNDLEMALLHAREIVWLLLSSETFEPEINNAHVLDLIQHVQNSHHEVSIDNKEAKSRIYYKEAKKLLKQAGGSANASELATMMDNVAAILLKEKKTESALRCYEEKLDFLERHQIEDMKVVSDTLRKLGSLCNKCGRYEEAIKYQQKALILCKSESIGSKKNDYHRMIRSLGSSNLASGNYSTSLKYFKSYLGVCSVYEKPYVLLTMGALYSKMYQIAEALNCYRKALQIELSTSGEEDKDTVASIAHLHDIFLSAKRRPKETRSCYEKALDSYDMKQILVNLGYVQLKNRTQKKDAGHDVARQAIKSARHFGREILGHLAADGEMLDITCVLRSMGNVLSRRRRYKEAIEYYEKFTSAKKPVKGKESHYHQQMFESLTDLGTAYLKTRDKQNAFASFQRALDELDCCATDKSGSSVSVEDNISALVAKEGNSLSGTFALNIDQLMALLICRLELFDEAAKMLLEVREKKTEAYGSKNADTAKLCIDLSTVIMLQGDVKAGRLTFDDGMQRLQQEKLPFFHPYMSQLRRLYSFLNGKKR